MKITDVKAYSRLVPMPGVSVHPDGYLVDQRGDVVKRAICPIPGQSSNRLMDGLIPNQVYAYKDSLKWHMGDKLQRQTFIEVLAELGGYGAVVVDGEMFQQPYTTGAHMKCAGVFWELITLPLDQRVILGPVVCKKLAKDFDNWRYRAKAFDVNLGFGEVFYSQFMLWGSVFRTASDNGLVNIY